MGGAEFFSRILNANPCLSKDRQNNLSVCLYLSLTSPPPKKGTRYTLKDFQISIGLNPHGTHPMTLQITTTPISKTLLSLGTAYRAS